MAEAASRKAPVAFDIDIGGAVANSAISHHHNDAKRGASSASNDADSFMPPIANNSRHSSEPPKKHWSASSDSKPTQERHLHNVPAKLPAVVDAESNDDDTVKADHFNSPVNNSVNLKKKGWGPPVELKDVKIARGVLARPSVNDDSTPPRSSALNNERDRILAARGAGSFESVANKKEDAHEDENEYVDDGDVMRRLELKRMSQIDARNRAKEVMKKLREMKKRDSEVGPGVASGKGSAKKQPKIGTSLLLPAMRNYYTVYFFSELNALIFYRKS